MYDLRIRVTKELLDEIQLLSHRAELRTAADVPIEAVILSAISRGLPAVRYEIDAMNEPRRLRLVK